MLRKDKSLELEEQVIHINKNSKTVKGGRRFSFSALVVVGTQKGHVGFALSKSQEVASAVKKAVKKASANMYYVPLKMGHTLHHDIEASYGAGKVILRSAPSGTGIIASKSMRAIFHALGVRDIVAKSLRSNNPHNIIRATFKALLNISSPRGIALKRGKNVSHIKGSNAQNKEV